MENKYLILGCMLLSGCAKNTTIIVDSELQPYFNLFQDIIGVSADGINGQVVALESSDSNEIGLCDVSYDNDIPVKTISVDSFYWAQANEDARIMLIFHELGHCALNLQHIATIDSDNCPHSLMFPYDFSNLNCFVRNPQRYYNELKSHVN